MSNIHEIIKYNEEKEITKEQTEKDLQISVKLQQIFEKNFFTTGLFEISNEELADITGKQLQHINRDIQEEFGIIDLRSHAMLFTPEGHNADMMMLGIEWLKDGIRVEKVLSQKGKERKIIYLSGVALTQLISRWDPMIRFIINVTIHVLQNQLVRNNIRVSNMVDFSNELTTVCMLAYQLENMYEYNGSTSKYPHIRENYEEIAQKIFDLRQEALNLKSKREKAYPRLLEIADEIRRIDKENQDYISKNEKLREIK